MIHQYIKIEETLYFWFGSNDASGSGDDGVTPLADIRLAGAAASAAPVLSPTPSLLSHVNFPPGCYEVAVAATTGNGFSAGNVYSVFCTLTVDSQNPTGFIGSFSIDPVLANITEISDDVTAADNLESQYDTTGLAGDTFPSTQAQLNNISSGTAAINTVVTSVTVTTGVEVNTFADTVSLDGTVHEVNPSAGNTEFYYEFNVGANGIPVSVQWQGYANSNGDSYGVYAWNWAGSVWNQIGTIDAVNGSSVITEQFDLTTAHVGTGGDDGLVRWRILSTDGTGFNTDRILCSFATVFTSIGYGGGAIWFDENASNTNTVRDIDGVADNPVSTWAAALTLNTELGMNRFHIAHGSTVTLSGNSDGFTLFGEGWILDINGQSISNIFVDGATVSGTGTGAIESSFRDCHIGTVTLAPSHCTRCSLEGIFTCGSAGTFFFENSYSGIAGISTPSFDFGSALNFSDVNFRNWSGGIEVLNMGAGTGSYTMSLEGNGQLIINANCSATSTIAIRGHFIITDNAGGAVTLSDNARYDVDQINAEILDVLTVDTFAEPSSVPAATSTIKDKLSWLFTLSRNKGTQTNTTKTLRNDADSADIASATVSDVAGTFTRGEFG